MEKATVTTFRSSLARLIARRDEFDCLFPSHGIVDVGPIMLNNLLEACDRVLADPEHPSEIRVDAFNGHKRVQYCQYVYNSGYLCYSLDRI